MNKAKAIETVHRLSEEQESLLMRLLAQGSTQMGSLVLRARLLGDLDPSSFEEAWRQCLRHHPVLRSSVHWKDLEHPVQVVHRQVEATVPHEDWRSQQAAEEALQQRVEEEKNLSLDLSRPPVMRLFLLRLAEREHLLLWTCHHLLLDGWSTALVLQELLERHAAIRDREPYTLAPSLRFQQYVAWSRRQDPAAASDLWSGDGLSTRELLASRPLTERGPGHQTGSTESLDLSLLSLTAESLEAWSRRHRLPHGCLFLACWGLTLAEATASPVASFGITSSGRGTPLDGTLSMVGMTTSTLPMHLRLDPEAALDPWLQEIFQRQEATRGFEHLPLARLLEAGGLSRRRLPFDTLLAHASYPLDQAAGRQPSDIPPGQLVLGEFQGDLTSAFPWTLAIEPGNPTRLRLHRRIDHGTTDGAQALLRRFAALLETAVGSRDSGPATVGDFVAQAPHPLPTSPLFAAAKAPLRRLGGKIEGEVPSPVEAQVIRIWNDLLEVQEIGPEDNFFELGGHSLLMPELLRRIQRDFGQELPLGAAFAAPTPRQLANLLHTDEAELDWPCLVPIRPQGDQPPLYLVHGLGGEVAWFYELADALTPGVPLFGLQAPAEPFENLQPMAAHYVEEIRQRQPRGPFRLGGYCVGGGVAYEMAQQLRRAGEEVELLILIDSVPQAEIAGSGKPSATRLAHRLKRLLAKEPREMVASVKDFARTALRRAERQLSTEAQDSPPELDDVLDMATLPQVYHRASQRHFRAMRDYTPEPYPGPMYLFRGADERFGKDYGWGKLVPDDLDVIKIDCSHLDILRRPHVAKVGEVLSRALLSLQAMSEETGKETRESQARGNLEEEQVEEQPHFEA